MTRSVLSTRTTPVGWPLTAAETMDPPTMSVSSQDQGFLANCACLWCVCAFVCVRARVRAKVTRKLCACCDVCACACVRACVRARAGGRIYVFVFVSE